MATKIFDTSDNKIVEGDSNKANKMVVNLSNKLKSNKSKKLTHMLNIKDTNKPIFLIPNTKKAFNYLRQTFIKC